MTEKIKKIAFNSNARAMSYLIIFGSALSYAFAFLFVKQLWWLTFLSLFLLYYTVFRYRVTFGHGAIWTFTNLSLLMFGIFFSLYKMADSSAYYIPIIALLTLIYVSMYGGIWFSVSQYLSNKLSSKEKEKHNQSSIVGLLIWSISSLLFFEFLYRALLWPFGVIEGLILIHPLLPLTKFPQILWPLSKIGITAYTLFFCFFACILAYPRIKNNYKLIFAVIILLILNLKAIFKIKHDAPTWLENIVYVPQSFYHSKNHNLGIKDATLKLETIVHNNNKIELILFPESSLYLCHVNNNKEEISKWNSANLGRNIDILIGGLRADNKKIYNTIYWINNGKIQGWYDKKHAMVLTERLPKWADFTSFRNLYYSVRPMVDTGKNIRPAFKISNDLSIIPFICSEIFFINNPDFNYPQNYPIVSLSNDNWVFMPYLELLMRLTNKFRAIQWSRNVMYIAYKHGLLYTTRGEEFTINKA